MVQHVLNALVAQVADVDEHGELLRLPDQVQAELGQPAFFQSAHEIAAVRSLVSAAPGQSKAPHPCGVKAVEQRQGGDGLRPLKGHEHAQFFAAGRLLEIRRAGAQHENVRGLCDLAVQRAHLLHGVLQGAVGQAAAVHKD